MNYFPKTAYCRPLFPNDENLYKTTNPYLKTRVPPVAENEVEFVLVKHNFKIYFSIPVFTSTYKNKEV